MGGERHDVIKQLKTRIISKKIKTLIKKSSLATVKEYFRQYFGLKVEEVICRHSESKIKKPSLHLAAPHFY